MEHSSASSVNRAYLDGEADSWDENKIVIDNLRSGLRGKTESKYRQRIRMKEMTALHVGPFRLCFWPIIEENVLIRVEVVFHRQLLTCWSQNLLEDYQKLFTTLGFLHPGADESQESVGLVTQAAGEPDHFLAIH